MRSRSTVLVVANVAIYTAGALVLFGWLAIRASNGGLFSTAPVYSVIVPSAPAIEANKSEVVTGAGVGVGVVTGVEAATNGCPSAKPSCVRIDFKISGDTVLKEDASAEIVITNMFGEKAVMVHVGESDGAADAGATIAFAGQSSFVEPDEALEPLAGVRDAMRDDDFKNFIDEQTTVFETAADDTAVVLKGARDLQGTLATQSVALGNVSRRTSDLLGVLAEHGDDIKVLTRETALLAQDVDDLLDGQLEVVSDGFALAADALQTLAGRQQELNDVLQRLPYAADLMADATDEMTRLLNNERGSFMYVAAYELPSLNIILDILKEGNG